MTRGYDAEGGGDRRDSTGDRHEACLRHSWLVCDGGDGPLFTIDADRLFSALIRQHLFVSLYRAQAESLAGERVSRLAPMQAAKCHIMERSEGLNADLHRPRQISITEELLDVVAGYEALAEE